MTKPRSQTIKDESVDRYYADQDLTIAAIAAEVKVDSRTVSRWLAERRAKDQYIHLSVC